MSFFLTKYRSKIIDAVRNEHDDSYPSNHVLYYYCDYTESSSSNVEQIFGALLKQLLLYNLVPEKMERDLVSSYGKSTSRMHETEILGILYEVLKDSSRIFSFFDGVDECRNHGRQMIINFINHCVSLRPACIKLLVSCRDEDRILESLNRWPRIQISLNNSAADVHIYITSSVQTRIESGELKFRDKSLQAEIESALCEKAGEM